MKHYLGIDIGATQTKVVLLDGTGQVRDREEYATHDSQAELSWRERVIEIIARKRETLPNGHRDDFACGISAPGLADANNSCILHMPERLPGIEGFRWGDELGHTVWVLNDGHAATLAEYETFYRDSVRHMLLLTLGTGVGGGAILDGRLYQGKKGRAGHFGHIHVSSGTQRTMTNMPGSLEYAIGNFSIGERTQGRFRHTKDLVTAYRDGDPLASHWWLRSVEGLALGLASLINAFSPELIVLGGGIAEADQALFEPLDKFLSLYEWQPGEYRVPLQQARHTIYAGAMGAALFCKLQDKS